MSNFTLKEKLKSAGVKQVLQYLDGDPEKNIPKIYDWLEKHAPEDGIGKHLKAARPILDNKDSNWNVLLKKLYTDIDPGVRKKLFENFLINTAMLGLPMEEKMRQKHDCNIPWAILFDPTSACNLHCLGCWAAEYDKALNLTFEEMDSIVTQGKELGTYMYIMSGGEPTIRRKDIFRLCEKHDDCLFSCFTNGQLIDESFADEMLRVKNFIPSFSVEGYKEANDFRRGEGTFDGVMRAMDILKEKKLPFGTSLCYTSKNTDLIGSEDFWDFIIDKGALFSWLFTYIPVGNDAVPELVVSAEQRSYMFDVIRGNRKTKPIFTIDFWNDGDYVDGCIAGGRRYLHINANGDIEPCAFIHYSDSNIREKTLLEAYKSPLFMQYRAHQPFNENLLRPCPMFDNVGALAEMIDATGAESTDVVSPEDVHDLTAKCEEQANNWEPVADKIWKDKLHKTN
ncbi:MAG: radical SAM protein [Peptostreptococcaceae bacterium]|nr:radical SAM protein [Peptostreptococcaceae bacterium]